MTTNQQLEALKNLDKKESLPGEVPGQQAGFSPEKVIGSISQFEGKIGDAAYDTKIKTQAELMNEEIRNVKNMSEADFTKWLSEQTDPAKLKKVMEVGFNIRDILYGSAYKPGWYETWPGEKEVTMFQDFAKTAGMTELNFYKGMLKNREKWADFTGGFYGKNAHYNKFSDIQDGYTRFAEVILDTVSDVQSKNSGQIDNIGKEKKAVVLAIAQKYEDYLKYMSIPVGDTYTISEMISNTSYKSMLERKKMTRISGQ